ncbi:protein FAM234A [Kryptolebias marmoratus]|uniref:Family with sequence similarity 234 member A n=1 Tax=Kryptolebias marmoratus TaxID=37003 RepID=A0A3Q3ASA0_KRYMA|nr:protein FAM234A [Kryptolebias marmoratus]
METADHATEDDPLKRGEDGTETVTAPPATELKNPKCKEGLGCSRMSRWRTAAFFLSLFLCLTVVFAFSFIIPCPVRPQYLVTWNRTFSEAGTYDFLAIEDASSDKVMDVLFVLKNTNSIQNKSCADAGLPSPCLFVLAVDGTDGDTLWERPLDSEFHWAQCGLDQEEDDAWHCLLSHSDNLTAIDKHTGRVVWQQPRPTGLPSSLPVLSVPDLDGDKTADVVLVASDNTQTQVILLSGKTGAQIGSTVVLGSLKSASHLVHLTKEGSYYVLFQKDTGVYGLALWKIAAKAGLGLSLKKDKHLEKNADAGTGLVPIHESDAVSLLRTKDTDDSSDLLVVSGNEVALVDGGKLTPRWQFNTSSILGIPSFGHFNKDNVLDVVVEEDIGGYRKRIIILDGKSGGVLWEVDLLASANCPRPASVHTTKSYSIFMFWGLMPSQSNSSESLPTDRHSYMLHPFYPKVLLEFTNTLDHIVAFKATLMERGRHAAYLLLTGPEKEQKEGAVLLIKRKLKQDVPLCEVRSIDNSGGSATKEAIMEAFNRLRFADW